MSFIMMVIKKTPSILSLELFPVSTANTFLSEFMRM